MKKSITFKGRLYVKTPSDKGTCRDCDIWGVPDKAGELDCSTGPIGCHEQGFVYRAKWPQKTYLVQCGPEVEILYYVDHFKGLRCVHDWSDLRKAEAKGVMTAALAALELAKGVRRVLDGVFYAAPEEGCGGCDGCALNEDGMEEYCAAAEGCLSDAVDGIIFKGEYPGDNDAIV